MFVYILKNQSMPGLYKIGFSANPVARAATLSAVSAVPTPFEVVHTIDCVTERQARRAEAAVHFILEYDRVSFSREFFSLGHENIGVRALISGAFIAWRADYQDPDWSEHAAELARWPIDRGAA